MWGLTNSMAIVHIKNEMPVCSTWAFKEKPALRLIWAFFLFPMYRFEAAMHCSVSHAFALETIHTKGGKTEKFIQAHTFIHPDKQNMHAYGKHRETNKPKTHYTSHLNITNDKLSCACVQVERRHLWRQRSPRKEQDTPRAEILPQAAPASPGHPKGNADCRAQGPAGGALSRIHCELCIPLSAVPLIKRNGHTRPARTL